jgi:hypothetical protein
MRRGVLTVLVSFVLGLSGVAAASVLTSGPSSPAPSKAPAGLPPSGNSKGSDSNAEGSDSGVHGGPTARFHDAGQCGLTDVSSLQGNWTHGDYVSAVAQAGGDQSLIPQAAHSDCGKPMVAVGLGGGPTNQAIAHMKAGKAHASQGTPEAGGKPSHSGD